MADSSVFSVRIVSIDHYMAPPVPGYDICYSSFQGGTVNEVPVLRIYGSTPAGQKTCLHVHRALPYLYVPYSDIPLNPQQEADAYKHAICLGLEKALKLKGNAGLKRQHVHGCEIVRAKKFYGYHSSEEAFVKIYLYYPHDVARAADLFRAAAILGKTLQPYEAHIPFILQFLVDYNLYGMGHVHVSQLKFRRPVPDTFSPGKSDYNSQLRQQMNEMASTAADFQAGSITGASSSSPAWTSTTIPGGWMWHLGGEFDASLSQHMHHCRRQSSCKLEGDATVNDILNLQFKVDNSLSQTQSDVKMVQSLVAIWEEEYERTGIQVEAMPPDPGRPFSEDVLKTLSHDVEFENRLRELCDEVKSIQASSQQDVKPGIASSAGEGISAADAHVKVEGSDSQTLYHAEDRNNTDIQDLKHLDMDGTPKDMVPSDADEVKYSEGIDAEALGLLKWLASSQAAEDVNSDDELLRESILNPLLPATIGKVLEKANMDYESQSQKECQDILDSVKDIPDLGDLEERSSSHSVVHRDSFHTLTDKKLHEIDGDVPDISISDGASEDSFKRDTKSHSKRKLCYQVLPDTSRSLSRKEKSSKTLWGSLPFSLTKNLSKVFDAVSSHVNEKCVNETKERLDASFTTGNESESNSDALAKHAHANLCQNNARTLVSCSVRDLMRRKRLYQAESPDYQPAKHKKVLSDGQKTERESILAIPKHGVNEIKSPDSADFRHGFLNQLQETCGPEPAGLGFPKSGMLPLVSCRESTSHCLNTLHREREEVLDTFCLQNKKQGSAVFDRPYESYYANVLDSGTASAEAINSDMDALKYGAFCGSKSVEVHTIGAHFTKEKSEEKVAMVSRCSSDLNVQGELPDGIHDIGQKPNSSIESGCKKPNEIVGADIINEMEKSGGDQVGDTSLNALHCSLPLAVSTIVETAGVVYMTLSKKTPAFDRSDVATEDAPHPSAIPHVCAKSSVGPSGRASDETLPFLAGYNEEEEDDQNKFFETIDSNKFQQEAVMGVPMHYLNDGSCLYLLTPAFSPPSADAVSRWLLHDEVSGPSGEVNTKYMEPLSLKGPSDCQIALERHSAPAECSKGGLTTAASASHVRPIPEQLHQQQNIILNAESNAYPEAKTPLETEGKAAESNLQTDGSQDISQISGPGGKSRATPLSQIGFRDPASLGGGQQLTLLSIEIQAHSSGDLRPDPHLDAVNVIALAFQNDNQPVVEVFVLLYSKDGSCQRNFDGVSGCKVFFFLEEKQLFNYFIDMLCTWDPDMLLGWDIQGGSLGFLAERAAQLGIRLLSRISRTPSEITAPTGKIETNEKEVLDNILPDPLIADDVQVEAAIIEDEWGRTHASGVHVGGRVVLNVWRLMRGEVKLNVYTVEAVADVVLRRRIPSISHKVLTKWFSSGPGQARYRCIEYVIQRANLNLEIVNQLDMINRTSELARVFGIDFFSVLSRGSQYRVESMLLRLAHTQNYLAISPGNQQVASQPAMECLPLVMEPESGFYTDPVVVLDFQSLYPSMIIAYNLCFCTCLGKIAHSKVNTLGVSSYTPNPHVLGDLKTQILTTPNGVMYVPPKVRKGILPRLLEEILSTRIMVKQAMKKLAPSEQVLNRIFNARQLALKLIANVTYGYTAAGFSGRMPCAELADSIVQCGRSTLEKAISFVNANDKWKARVVYGDTDSMFVLLKGRTVKEAFQIGQEIASAVTAINPNPVMLKMEKVYHPCFLLTKKRYVGYSYESPDQIEPVFDAKGIETIRRDTCAAVAKTMEQSLRLFFEQQDISEVKKYLHRQWKRILSGRVSLQDFVFAKEVRLGTYATRDPSLLPPAAIVATKAMRLDPRAEPRYAERVPYVVIHGEPGARLVDMVVDPLDLLDINSPYRLNDLYYIKKQIIPALQRVFGLVGADLNQWFSEMPRPARESLGKRPLSAQNPQRTRIDYYYLSKHCMLCGELVLASAHLCNQCLQKESAAMTAIIGRTSKLEREMQHLAAICRHCGGGDWIVESGVKCTSLVCSVFYERRKVQKELRGLSSIAAEKGLYPKCMVEWF